MIKQYISLLILMLTLSCSPSSRKNEIQNFEVVITEMNTWLNLMPGSPGKFFLQGEMIIKNLTGETIEDISIDNLKVYSKEKLLFNFIPILELKNQEDQKILQPRSSLEFRFRTDGGIRLGNIEIPDDKVDVIFSVTCDSGKYIVDLKNINVERTY